jgi:prepilin-type processing-associated H-X9-DG protein
MLKPLKSGFLKQFLLEEYLFSTAHNFMGNYLFADQVVFFRTKSNADNRISKQVFPLPSFQGR